jgi:hypothetical protein
MNSLEEEVKKQWETSKGKGKHKRKTKNGKWKYSMTANSATKGSEITDFISQMNDLDEEIID